METVQIVPVEELKLMQEMVSVTLTDVALNNNNAGIAPAVAAPGNGGGLHITGNQNITITDGSTNNNTAANEGGGLWNGSGIMNLGGDLTITSNSAAGEASAGAMNIGEAGGGGIYNEGGSLVITGDVEIASNTASGSTSTGGGILVAGGSLEATGTIITVNGANRAGGGIEANNGAAVTLTNVILNDNTAGVVTGAGAPGNGGGLHISGNSTVDITGGTVNVNTAMSEGGGLWNGTGTMTIDGTTIDGNTASGAGADNGGGGIYALNGGTVNIINSATIANNVADGASGSGGGILVDADANLTVDTAIIRANRANRAGGGIEIVAGTGTISLTNTNLNSNNVGIAPAVAAPGNGGGLHISGNQDITITGGTVSNNDAASEGGGLWNGTGLMTLSNIVLDNNSAQGDAAVNGGGAIYNNGGDIDASDLTITDNLATGISGSGGGLFSTDGDITINNSELSNNSANRAGGAIEIVDGDLEIDNSDILNNDVNGTAGVPAPGNGGALHISGAAMVDIDNSNISNNTAATEGGALWNQVNSTMVISNSLMDGNVANGTAIDNGGGAIFNNGGATEVYDSTLSNNDANGSNGGAIANEIGTLIVEVSTISTNTSTLDGAGIYNNGTSADLNAVTVANNTATGNGGGISTVAGTFNIKNTLVAENTGSAGSNVNGSITSLGFNLVETDNQGAVIALGSDRVGTTAAPEQANLGPLQVNIQGLPTHALLQDSRAQDIGDPNDTFTDQRGFAVFGPARDAGAYEAQMSLGLEEQLADGKSSKLYPNPVSNGIVTVAVSENHVSGASYQVFDMSGKQLLNGNVTNGTNELSVNGLSSGAYIIMITSSSSRESLRMLID